MDYNRDKIKPDFIILIEVALMSSCSSNNIEERALLSLVQDTQTGNKTWAWTTFLHGWEADSGIPVCEWEGITCHAASRGEEGYASSSPSSITGVEIYQQGLSGTIPTEIGLLTELEHLSLSNNLLRGSIPQEVANLAKLKTLDMTNCLLTGTLPQHFQSSQLEQLLLADNAISGKFFEQDDSPHLRSIRQIRMENNLLTGTLHGASIANMNLLKILSLSENDLSGLIPGMELGSLPNLHYLYLDGNHLVGPLPSQLAQPARSQLFELWVQGNALSGTVPASFSRFYQLHDLYIDNNKLTGALPQELCSHHINEHFYADVSVDASLDANRNYCESIACPAGTASPEGMYPCKQCPGGELAKLQNRYLGLNGACSNYNQREILEIFHKATTKGGAWNGKDDWGDKSKSVCQMTGITCDAQDHVTKIELKNRNLQGSIPDQIGLLSFLDVLDASDNALTGFVPGDLQWTSLKQLDLSGNKHHGLIPPLLCKMGEVNGNGEDNIFRCNRIACPAGTYNDAGYHHGSKVGDECMPCYDHSPYIGQKTCAMPQPPRSGWKEMIQMAAKEGHKRMHIMMAKGGWESQEGAATAVASVTVLAASIVAIAIFWYTRRPVCPVRPAPEVKISRVRFNEDEKDDKICKDQHFHILRRDDVRVFAGENMGHDREEEEENIMDECDSSCDSSPYRPLGH